MLPLLLTPAPLLVLFLSAPARADTVVIGGAAGVTRGLAVETSNAAINVTLRRGVAPRRSGTPFS